MYTVVGIRTHNDFNYITKLTKINIPREIYIQPLHKYEYVVKQ
jgi:hypothetical protein